MSTKVTLQDLADMAGVHRSTVSLALRDHPRISQEVRRRVQALAKKHGYRIHPLVAALMQSRRTGGVEKHVALAYVTNYPTRDGWRPPHHDRPDFFPGAVQRAQELGYKLEHFWLGEPGMTKKRFCDILVSRGIHGLVIGRLPPGQSSMELEWERFSAVALGMTLRQPLLHHVTENHFDTARQAVRQCLKRGYRRIGFVFSEADDSPRVGTRWLGAHLVSVLQADDAVQLAPCPEHVDRENAFREWFARERPDAIIATHARPVLGWLGHLGVSVPEQVGVVDLAADPHVDCASVRHDPHKIGGLAVEMLVGLMQRHETGVPLDQHEILLTGVWHEGRTLRPPPQGA
ncbi:hypothetical protein ASA1KI_44100 [Opitutales bacterium ASA1]|uniref:LacI family DNA-binding transcriptional regulator n=1 Tax=Congregicoccus parvus TaxID=3081749 RepID=UPI002B2C2925|nr:hypothetical protein ASA1KI_44100 [Opitutales bacterium ASA1]